jgi:phosphoribosylaminoimidazolecarboxamide formyltransferase/IMP cyclohydrolase
VDAAVHLIADFDEPTFAILKHNNACGLASRPTLAQAYLDALAGDPVSAFGGVLVANREIGADTAIAMNDLFFEVVIAPSYSDEALEILKQKKNRVILVQKPCAFPARQFRTLLNGVLEQDRDLSTQSASDMQPVTTLVPNASELEDLVFANKLVKHTKSNTIVLAKNKQLLSSGCGMTSRVDALEVCNHQSQCLWIRPEGSGDGIRCFLSISRLCGDCWKRRHTCSGAAGRVHQGQGFHRLLQRKQHSDGDDRSAPFQALKI